MLYRVRPEKVFFYAKPVDFRKQINGLAMIIESEFSGKLALGYWFVFVASDKKKVKIIYWRGTGFVLWQLRLEKESFAVGSPRVKESCLLTWRNLGRFLDGHNIFSGAGHTKISAKRFS